jgi:hypothetical protein
MWKDKGDETKPATSKNQIRNALIKYRWALGLCFKCVENYYHSHQCKVKVHMLLDQEKEENKEEEQEGGNGR